MKSETPHESNIPVKKNLIPQFMSQHARLLGITILVIAIAGFGVWQFTQNQKLEKQISKLQGTDQSGQAEVKALVAKVGKLIVLPDEEPTVATVTDPSKLSNQSFFATAQTGDKVLIYAGAKKAVLYRPSESKIIEVAPVNIDGTKENNAQVAGSTTQITDKASITISVQNAGKTSGLAKKVAEKLNQAGYTNVTVSDAQSGVSDKTSMTYGDAFRTVAPEINKVLGDQAVSTVQIGATSVTIVLGTDFKLVP
jgi:hypothetical protein